MWLVSARDLQFRLRRFLIAVAVTALVFAIAVVIDGVKRSAERQGPRIVTSFRADTWVVDVGAAGPFATTKVIPGSAARALRDEAEVTRADPMISSRAVVADKDVNLIGYVPGGLGAPNVVGGRGLRGDGEAVVGASVDAGDQLTILGRRFRVVGRTDGSQYNFGIPTVYVSLADAQALMFGGQSLAMGIAVQGNVSDLPEGLVTRTNAQAVDDLGRISKNGISLINFVAALLWLIAAGIIGAIVYLSALERVRDFAVFKATGAPNRLIVGSVVLQAVLVSVVAAAIAVGLAFLMTLAVPFPAEIGAKAFAQLGVIAIFVGGLASLSGVRRALTTDPAVAFGGA